MKKLLMIDNLFDSVAKITNVYIIYLQYSIIIYFQFQQTALMMPAATNVQIWIDFEKK